MNDLSDSQLLDAYAQRRSEPAFTELVQRHVDLVYSAALRIVGDAHAARDVSQSVFIALAQNASKLAHYPALAGWLYCTTRNLGAKFVRSDVRRRVREQEAATMNELLGTDSDANWDRIAALLDEALGELDEPDRDALLLRYFKNQDLRAVGSAFGISDDAAQKRVSRALEYLRELLGKRGLRIGVSGLAACLSANAVLSAPAGLALELSKAALVFGTTAIATHATLANVLYKALIGTTLAAVVGAGIYEARQASQARSRSDELVQQQSKLTAEIDQLRRERDAAAEQASALRHQNGMSDRDQIELLKLRDEVARLRAQADHRHAASPLVQVADAVALPIPTEANPRTGQVELKWDSVMVLGINRMPSGKHAMLYVVAKRGEGSPQVKIQAYLLSFPTGFMQPAAFGQILGTFLPEQADMQIEAEKNRGSEVFNSDPATVQSGEQARILIDINQAGQSTIVAPKEPSPNNPSGVFPAADAAPAVAQVIGYISARTEANPAGVFPGPGSAIGTSSESANKATVFLGETRLSQVQPVSAVNRAPLGLGKMVVKVTPTISDDAERVSLAVEAWFSDDSAATGTTQ